MKLNLGSRSNYPVANSSNDWTTVDIDGGDITYDLRDIPWPWKNNTVECIYASHILEHMTKAQAYTFLQECHRVLQHSGLISIAVPDFDILLEAVKKEQYIIDDLSLQYCGVPVIIGQNYSNGPQAHQYVFSFESLAWILYKCKFINIKQVTFEGDNIMFKGVQQPAYKNISLYVEAQKK